jgi:membrane protease YdiL (CAAX protease family)
MRGTRAIQTAIGLFVLLGLVNSTWRNLDAKALFWLADVSQFVVLPLAVVPILARKFEIGPRDYGFVSMQKSGVSAFNVITLAWVTLLLFLANELTRRYLWLYGDFARPEVAYQQLIPSGPARPYVIVYFAVTAALVEEMVYRGLFWRALSDLASRYRVVLYVIGSSLLFGAIHWENGWPEVIAAGVFSILACLIYLRIQTLWPLVLAHFVSDLRAFTN